MKSVFKTTLLIFIAAILCLSAAQAGDNWVTGEYQFDTRQFNTLNVMGLSNLPHGFVISGFTDFEGDKNRDSRSPELVTHFTEIDLRTSTWHGVAIISELNSATGADNDLGRLGLFYRPEWNWLKKINFSLFFKGFPVETDGRGSQVNGTWNLVLPPFERRISLGGFFDLNIESGPDKGNHAVSDTQFRVRLIGDLSFLVEYRFNDFLPPDKKDGVGIGIKYRF